MVSMSAGFLVLAAFLAGVVSFSSPCCLPLLPGYVAYVSGNTGAQRQPAGRIMTAAGLFTLGFGLTFTALARARPGLAGCCSPPARGWSAAPGCWSPPSGS
jgi:cytochrome c biogenesis protein CcdA